MCVRFVQGSGGCTWTGVRGPRLALGPGTAPAHSRLSDIGPLTGKTSKRTWKLNVNFDDLVKQKVFHVLRTGRSGFS